MKALSLLALLFTPALALWPLPTSLTSGNSTLKLSSSFSISTKGVSNAPTDLQQAIQRTSSHLRNDKLERLVVGRGASDASSFSHASELKSLTISISKGKSLASISSESTKPIGTRDESYELIVPADGSAATLTASTSLGLLRGLTTFEQMWYTFDGTVYAIEMPMTIKDTPAYPYRGFMLDTARNFFPVSDILRTIDAMSWVKINTFHWHIVDSQSFPLSLPSFPELASKGAYSASMIYTPADIKTITTYANARGIDVLPEFDTPGHTSAISESHPEHIACAPAVGAAYDDTLANEPPAGQLRFAVPATQSFTTSVIKSFASLFPTSSMFSTGGDELNTNCYANDAPFQAALKASGQTFEQALSTFTQKEHAVVRASSKAPVVWEEMVLDHNVTLGNDTVVMVWISSEDAAQVVQKGFKIVHAPSNYFYLDCGGGGWLGNFQGNSWCDPFKTWQVAYSFDPLANISASSAHLVLGGQQLLWAEQSGPENLDSIVWPRAAASAEVFWTGAARPSAKESLKRLHDVRYRFVQRGVKAINLQPLWCAIRPNQCDLSETESQSATPEEEYVPKVSTDTQEKFERNEL